MQRLIALALCSCLLGTTLAVVPLSVPTSDAAKKKKKAKKPAKKRAKQAPYTYSGRGSVASVGEDDTTLTVDFSSANRSLAKALGAGSGTADVTVTDATRFTLDGDADVDFFDLCSGDSVEVRIVTRKRLTSDTLSTVSATEVKVSSNEQDCEPPSIDE